MARCLVYILVLLVFCVYFVSSSVFEEILDGVEPCKAVCDKTYPLHTYPNAKHASSCKRGCRFYSLVEFINDSNNVNATKDACMASCMEAYSQTADRYACNIGCGNHPPTKKPSEELNSSDQLATASLHHVPFIYMNNLYNSMMNHMSRFLSVSWSVYLQQGDGKLLVVQSEPEILTEYMDVEDGEKSDENNSVENSQQKRFNDGQNLPLPDVYFEQLRMEQPDSSSLSRNDEVLPLRITVNTYTAEDQSVDWLGCVSRKSGLPRWLLAMIIFFSAVIMIWLCFTTTAIAPEHHIRPQLLSFSGDLEYLKNGDIQEKVKIQPECCHEAPPLPLKIAIGRV